MAAGNPFVYGEIVTAGAFADLTLQLRFDPADPARILELSADTAAGEGGYHETLVLLPEK